MPRPHSEIPSQRLAVGRAQPSATPAKPYRSNWWSVAIIVIGWTALAYPIVLLGLLSFIFMTGTYDGSVTVGSVAFGILGVFLTLSMLAFPVLLGMAVKVRRRRLWISAIVTGVLTVAAFLYLTSQWIIPLAGT